MNILIQQGLIVTVIGMGLVFVVIIFFWWMMNVLVRATTKNESPTDTGEVKMTADTGGMTEIAGLETRRRAAAAAVAVALAMEDAGVHKRPGMTQGEMAGMSPWQSTHRAQQLAQYNKRG